MAPGTESPGGMAPTSIQAPSSFFDIKSIGEAIYVDGIGIPSRVEELDCWFEEERRDRKKQVRYLVPIICLFLSCH